MDKQITQKLYKNPDTFLYEENFFAYIQYLQDNHKLSALPHNLYVYYVLSTLAAEVNNGGFSQFLFNSSRLLFGDLNVCAEDLGIGPLTSLICEFVEVVKKENKCKVPDEFELSEETDGMLSGFDERYYELDGIYDFGKAFLKYYKDNFTVKSVTYTAVKEKESDTCRFFVYDNTACRLSDSVKAYLDFISGFKGKWDIVISDFNLTAKCDRDCIVLSELFDVIFNRFELVKYMTAFGSVRIDAPLPESECRENLTETNSVYIEPSGFGENEYRIKQKYGIGFFNDSPLAALPHTYICVGKFDDSGKPHNSKQAVLDEILLQIKKYKQIKSVYSERYVSSGGKPEIKKEYYMKRI